MYVGRSSRRVDARRVRSSCTYQERFLPEGRDLRARSVLGLLPWNSVLLTTVRAGGKRLVSGRQRADSAVMVLHDFRVCFLIVMDSGCCPAAARRGDSSSLEASSRRDFVEP